ncbi:hypothetical protein BG005_006537 [Podila minutissima]|nr:hypothetical protein BG005_006537 [Podila minutissima]
MERPVIMPISTETRSSHTSPSDAYSVKRRLGAGLPSPPLSPQQDYGFAKRSSATLSSLPFITVSDADSDDNHNDSDTASLTLSVQDLALLPSNSPSSFTSAYEPEDTPTTPMLPSQLRRRHESLKLQSKQQQQPSSPPPQPFLFSTSKYYEDDYNSDDDNDPSFSHSQLNTPDLSLAPPTSSSLSPQPTHSLVRAKSYSQFETNRKAFGYSPISSYTSTSPSLSSYHTPSTGAMPEMSTRDWVKMQSRINELEMQISHVSRANQLLNQELDKVNGHLLRLTSDENGECDEGWRREYEFLVQQVDIMHRQLQMAQNPQYQYQLLMQHQQQLQQQQQQQQLPAPESADRSEVSRQLHSEVKELTESLRSWQAAFQQAEEKYRRKCDGERALKQTLRERETQLSGLVSKLSSYESDFQRSIADYTTQIDTLLAKNNNNSGSSKAVDENEDKSKKESEDMHMPGTFPSTTEHTDSNDQFSVSILSWAALLATYMLS